MKTLVGLLVLLVLLVVADRVALGYAERAVASRLTEVGQFSADPEVEVHGFPFLTQAVAGTYDDVTVRAPGVQTGDVRITQFTAELRGVDVPLSDALSGSIDRIPVEELASRALLSYADLSAATGDRGLTVSPASDGRVRVTGQVEVLGRRLSASAISRLELDDGALLVTAESYEVGNGMANSVLNRALGGRLDVRVPVGPLPYGLQVDALRVTDEGVVVTSTARDVVLMAP